MSARPAHQGATIKATTTNTAKTANARLVLELRVTRALNVRPWETDRAVELPTQQEKQNVRQESANPD